MVPNAASCTLQVTSFCGAYLLKVAVYSQILVLPVAEYRLSHKSLLNKTYPFKATDHGMVGSQAVSPQAMEPPVMAT